VSLSAGSADDSRERAERLATQAEKILDTWSGQQEKIVEARKLIAEALKLDQNCGHAMVEQGRSIIMERDIDPQTAQVSGALFKRASTLNPPYGRAFVLLGYLHTEMGQWPEAFAALTKADTLVPNDPWLKLNWGSYYAQSQGRTDKELQYAEQAIATGTKNVKALVAAYEILLKGQLNQRNREKADVYYAKAAEAQPGSAWVRGNYGRNVIMYFGDFDSGERLAREALAIMDYPHARQTLSLALYGRWALAVKEGKPLAASEPLYQVAYRNDPGGRSLPECAMSWKPLGFVFEAVATKGIERRSMQRC
jgi:tetratricopeptide (TPR) repeat protein